MYLWPKANIQEAAHDHDYLEEQFTEYRVDRVFEVTHEKQEAVESQTHEQVNSKLWHNERLWGD